MNEYIKSIQDKAEFLLKNDEKHKNKLIDFIIINLNTDEAIVFASDNKQIIQFSPVSEKSAWVLFKASFDYEEYLLENLEADFRVGYVRKELHLNLWNFIQNHQNNLKKGIQTYLQFCADYGITKKSLGAEVDIMKYFEGLAFQETMDYKDYIIEADDTNFDNPREVLVNIYKSQKNFEKGKILETISLNEIGLKENIKEYIDACYINNHKKTCSKSNCANSKNKEKERDR